MRGLDAPSLEVCACGTRHQAGRRCGGAQGRTWGREGGLGRRPTRNGSLARCEAVVPGCRMPWLKLRHVVVHVVSRALLPPLLLLASTVQGSLDPRITSSRTRFGRNTPEECKLQKKSPCAGTTCESLLATPIPVPVGGTLLVQLEGECSTCNVHKIDNARYGYPGIQGSSMNFTKEGWVSFAPTINHAGLEYDLCALTENPDNADKLYTCIKVAVKSHHARFVSPAPADRTVFETQVGRELKIDLPSDTLIPDGCDFERFEATCTSGSLKCPVVTRNSTCQCQNADGTNRIDDQGVSQGAMNCGAGCQCMRECPLGPLPKVRAVRDKSYPQNAGLPDALPDRASLTLRTHLPDGTKVSAESRAQPWVFRWQPTYSQRSHVPARICFEAYATGLTGNYVEERCYGIIVAKCRQCLQAQDTLDSVAKQHKTDWLHIYYANPSLPGFNPSHIKPGDVIRLGVQYDTRWGDDLDVLSERFLVPQSNLLDQNPELSAATFVSYKPNVPGAHVQVSLVFRPRRRILAGENMTAPLAGIEGQDWEGLVSETCDSPSSTLELDRFCSPETNSVDDKCGPGLWGVCKYDDTGVMGCLTYRCNGRGAHTLIDGASWESADANLILMVGSTIEAGQEVNVVVPQSAGLRMHSLHRAPTHIDIRTSVPELIWNPMADSFVPMKMCVVLPMCDSNVECLYGSDCHLREESRYAVPTIEAQVTRVPSSHHGAG